MKNNEINRNLLLDTVGATNADKYFPEKVKPSHEVPEYAATVSECHPNWTDTEIAESVAFVYLQPKNLFRLWLDALAYKYLKR